MEPLHNGHNYPLPERYPPDFEAKINPRERCSAPKLKIIDQRGQFPAQEDQGVSLIEVDICPDEGHDQDADYEGETVGNR